MVLGLNIAIDAEVTTDGNGAWPDLIVRGFTPGTIVAVTGLSDGTRSGRPTVCFRIELPGEIDPLSGQPRVVLAETTLALFATASGALVAAHGDPRERTP